jgi:hypothetical protein
MPQANSRLVRVGGAPGDVVCCAIALSSPPAPRWCRSPETSRPAARFGHPPADDHHSRAPRSPCRRQLAAAGRHLGAAPDGHLRVVGVTAAGRNLAVCRQDGCPSPFRTMSAICRETVDPGWSARAMRRTTASLSSMARRLRRLARLHRGLLAAGILAVVVVLAAVSAWTVPAPAEDATARGSLVATSHPALPAAGRPTHAARPATRRPAPSTVIAAAGDIACDPASRSFRGGRGTATACRMRATARLVRRLHPRVVLTLGDDQYETPGATTASTWAAGT